MKHLFIVLTFLFLSSCSEDAFSTVVKIDTPEVEKLLVINSYAKVDRYTTPAFHISTGYGIFDNADINDLLVNDVNISISNSEGRTYTYPEDKFEFAWQIPDSIVPDFNYLIDVDTDFYKENEEFTFKFEHPDYPTSETTLAFPSIAIIENIDYRYDAGINFSGQEVSSVSFDILDESGIDNYYKIFIWSGDIRLSSIDPALSGDTDKAFQLYLSDASFDGQRKNLRMNFLRKKFDPDGPYDLGISIQAINEGYFKHEISLQKQAEAERNPLASPVPIYSNLNNAVGVIGLSADTIYVYTP